MQTEDEAPFACTLVPGAVALDAPVRTADGRADWLLGHLHSGFTALRFCGAGERVEALPLRTLAVFPAGGIGTASANVTALEDIDGLVAQRYDARPGTTYLIRPDQHVCARWRALEAAKLAAALLRATGQTAPAAEPHATVSA